MPPVVTPALLESERRQAFVLSIDHLLKELDDALAQMKRDRDIYLWLPTLPPRR